MATSRKKVSLDQLKRQINNLSTISSINISSDKNYFYKLEEFIAINIVMFMDQLDEDFACIDDIHNIVWDEVWNINACNIKKDFTKRNSKNKEILKVLQA